MNKEETKEEFKPNYARKEDFDILLKTVNDLVKRTVYLEREFQFYKEFCLDQIKRIQALEHPNMDAPLKAFQKLRSVLREVDEASFRETKAAL